MTYLEFPQQQAANATNSECKIQLWNNSRWSCLQCKRSMSSTIKTFFSLKQLKIFSVDIWCYHGFIQCSAFSDCTVLVMNMIKKQWGSNCRGLESVPITLLQSHLDYPDSLGTLQNSWNNRESELNTSSSNTEVSNHKMQCFSEKLTIHRLLIRPLFHCGDVWSELSVKNATNNQMHTTKSSVILRGLFIHVQWG